MNGPSSQAKTLSAILALLTALALVAVVGLAWWSISHPLLQSPEADRIWRVGVIASTALAGVATAIRRPRWVSRATIVAVTVVLLLSAIPGRNAADLALVLWVCVVAAGLGGMLLRRCLGPHPDLPVPFLGITVPLGLGIIAIIWWVVGLAGLLAGAPILISLLVLTLLTRTYCMAVCAYALRSIRQFWENPSPIAALAAAIMAIAAFFPAMWASVPDTVFDAMLYQLSVPASWVKDGQIHLLPFNDRTSWSALAGAIYGPLLAVVGQPAPSMISFVALLLTATIGFGLGRTLAGTRVGWISAVTIVVTPRVASLGGNTHPDILVACFTALTAALGLWWISRSAEPSRGWLVLMGCAAGFAFSVKLNAVSILVPVALVLLGSIITLPSHRLRRSRDLVLIGGLSALVVASPWLITRALWMGNPVHPFLAGLFSGPTLDLGNPAFDWANFGVGTGVSAFLRLPWDLSVHSLAFGDGMQPAAYGLLPLLSLPIFLLVPGTADRAMAIRLWVIVILGSVFWFATAQYGRYALPLMPLAAALVAANLDMLLRWAGLGSASSQRVRMVAAGTLLLIGTASLTILTASQTWQHPSRIPVAAVFGQQSREEFLTQMVRTYPAMQELARVDSDRPTVLQIGSPNALYTDAFVSHHEAPHLNVVRHITDPVLLEEALRNGPWDYLIIDNLRLLDSGFSSDSLLANGDEFLSNRFPKLWQQNGVSLWRLRAEAQPDVAPSAGGMPKTSCDLFSSDPCIIASAPVPNRLDALATVAITWHTGDGANGTVHVGLDDQSANVFASGPNGRAEAPWIQSGVEYVFTLRGDDGTELARTVVFWNP